jgi:hypothetical protein
MLNFYDLKPAKTIKRAGVSCMAMMFPQVFNKASYSHLKVNSVMVKGVHMLVVSAAENIYKQIYNKLLAAIVDLSARTREELEYHIRHAHGKIVR